MIKIAFVVRICITRCDLISLDFYLRFAVLLLLLLKLKLMLRLMLDFSMEPMAMVLVWDMLD